LDHTHSLARRIGLAQLPLACIATRFLQDVWARVVRRFDVPARVQAELLVKAFVVLFLLKVLTGIVLAGVCAEYRIVEETRKFKAKSGGTNTPAPAPAPSPVLSAASVPQAFFPLKELPVVASTGETPPTAPQVAEST
jgi:hypothetical protein